MTLGKDLIAWLGDSTGSASEHHLEVVGLDINVAAACLAESSGLRSSEEAGTSFGAITEVLVVAVDTAGVSWSVAADPSKVVDNARVALSAGATAGSGGSTAEVVALVIVGTCSTVAKAHALSVAVTGCSDLDWLVVDVDTAVGI